jgi:hypothetical protein
MIGFPRRFAAFCAVMAAVPALGQTPTLQPAPTHLSAYPYGLTEAETQAAEDAASGRRGPPKIAGGDPTTKAPAYYARIGSETGFTFEGSTLDDLIHFFGYRSSATARELETIVPNAARGAFDRAIASESDRYWYDQQNSAVHPVLVSRFFAPKIVNYSVTSRSFTPGWRKLVYLPARLTSEASSNGLSGAYILFNYFAPDPAADPFLADGGDRHNISKNNQVIIGRANSSTPGPFRDNNYFAVYSGYDAAEPGKSYTLLNTLQAGFDIPPDGELKSYAVPDACAHCHGHDKESGRAVDATGAPVDAAGEGTYPFVKPNYLDTDQWYDALRLDFPAVAASTNDPVFDGGKDHDSPSYQEAMNVIKQLNRQMKAEGSRAKRPSSGQAAAADGFQLGGVDTWLKLHGERLTHVFRPDERLFDLSATGAGNPFDRTSPDNGLALDKLSQYCFRCHSSIKFSTFQFDFLARNKGTLAGYLGLMPLGRTLDKKERDCLAELLRNFNQPSGLEGVEALRRAGQYDRIRGDFPLAKACSQDGTGSKPAYDRLSGQIGARFIVFSFPNLDPKYIELMPGLRVCAPSGATAMAARLMGESREIRVMSYADLARAYANGSGPNGPRECEIILTRRDRIDGNEDESLALNAAMKALNLDGQFQISVIWQ